MIQGWRPTSVTTQPASMAAKPMGAVSRISQSSRRVRLESSAKSDRRRHQMKISKALSAAIQVPMPTMA